MQPHVRHCVEPVFCATPRFLLACVITQLAPRTSFASHLGRRTRCSITCKFMMGIPALTSSAATRMLARFVTPASSFCAYLLRSLFVMSCDCYCVTTGCLCFHPMAQEHVHALKGLACRKRVAAASSPAATCKQVAALTSPARHACGCARPSRARFGHRSSKFLSDGSKT